MLSPANVQEVLDLGVYGWELSRYSGCWVALKAITENMDSAISADIDPARINIVIPEDFELPPAHLSCRIRVQHDGRPGHGGDGRRRPGAQPGDDADAESDRRNEERIAELGRSGRWPNPIVTEVKRGGRFWPAEEYHQRYFEKNGAGFCHVK